MAKWSGCTPETRCTPGYEIWWMEASFNTASWLGDPISPKVSRVSITAGTICHVIIEKGRATVTALHGEYVTGPDARSRQAPKFSLSERHTDALAPNIIAFEPFRSHQPACSLESYERLSPRKPFLVPYRAVQMPRASGRMLGLYIIWPRDGPIVCLCASALNHVQILFDFFRKKETCETWEEPRIRGCFSFTRVSRLCYCLTAIETRALSRGGGSIGSLLLFCSLCLVPA